MFAKTLTPDQISGLDAIPTEEEIKEILFSLHSNKAPGPDGYNAYFFKATWDTTGPFVLATNKEFFLTGELLKKSNATLISKKS